MSQSSHLCSIALLSSAWRSTRVSELKKKTHEIFLSIPMKGDIVGSWVVSFDSLCSMSAAKRVWCAEVG